MSVSSCCSAELKVSYGSEGTGCYLCNKCGKPCDAKEEKMSKRSQGERWFGTKAEIMTELNNDFFQYQAGLISVGTLCQKIADWEYKRSESIVYDRDRLEAENAKLKAALKKAGEALEFLTDDRHVQVSTSDEFCNYCGDKWPCCMEKAKQALSDPTMKRVMEEKS